MRSGAQFERFVAKQLLSAGMEHWLKVTLIVKVRNVSGFWSDSMLLDEIEFTAFWMHSVSVDIPIESGNQQELMVFVPEKNKIDMWRAIKG